MLFTDKLGAHYLSFTERSKTISTITNGMAALVVIFGIDLLWHFGGLNWYWGQLASDAFEATLLALIATRLSHLREERIIRRQREMGYLNHHIRNSLNLILMTEDRVRDADQRANVVRQASSRICKVLEQLRSNEDVSIDNESPEQYLKGRKSA